MNGTANIHFNDGTKIDKVEDTPYLGGILDCKGGRVKEINRRISKAMGTCQRLKLFWSKSKAPLGWKLQVFNAIIISQLTYGLNTISITDSTKNRLNAFHVKGLRRILGIAPAYYSGISNEKVIERMNLVINRANPLEISWQQFCIDKQLQRQKYKTTVLVGDLVWDRQIQLLGHILRRDSDDLIRSVTCDSMLERPQKLFKRVGRPKQDWLSGTLERAHIKIGKVNRIDSINPITGEQRTDFEFTREPQDTPFDKNDPTRTEHLKEAALIRRI